MKTTRIVSAVVIVSSLLVAAQASAGGLTKQSCSILETTLRTDYSTSEEIKYFADYEEHAADPELQARFERVADARARVFSTPSSELLALIRSYRDGQYDNLSTIIAKAQDELAPVRETFKASCPVGTTYTDYDVTDEMVGCFGESLESHRPTSGCLLPWQVATAKKDGGLRYYAHTENSMRDPEVTKFTHPDPGSSYASLRDGRNSLEARSRSGEQVCLPDGSFDKWVTDHWSIKSERQLREQNLREARLSILASRGDQSFYTADISLLDLLTPPKKTKSGKDLFDEDSPRSKVQSEDEYVRAKLPKGCPLNVKEQVASAEDGGASLKRVASSPVAAPAPAPATNNITAAE